MSVGGIIGGVVGGVAGFLVAGPTGAYIGASIGLGIGMAVDPIMPDVPGLGQADTADLSITKATSGAALMDLRGVTSSVGHHIWYDGNRTVAIKSEVSGGKGGGSEEVTTGYKYYLSWAVALCQGPVDRLLTVFNGDDCVWAGELERTAANEATGEVIELCGLGSARFYWGSETQDADSVILSFADDATLVPAYRGTCYAVMDDCKLGQSNRAPSLRFVFQKTPDAHGPTASIGPYDFNPVWALYDVLTEMIGISTDYVDASNFAEAAETALAEGIGVSISFSSYQDAATYAESLLTHMDAVLLFDADAQFVVKMLRADAESSDLPVVSDASVLDPVELTRPSWLDMHNVIQVQYPRRYPLADCCDEELCDEDAPSLELLYCDNVLCFDLPVDSIEDGGATLVFATSLSIYSSVLSGGKVAFGSELKTIVSADASSIEIESAFSSDPSGERVAISTTQSLPDTCDAMGLFSVTDGNLPLTVQLAASASGPWQSTRQVSGRNFAARCKPAPCIAQSMRVVDSCDQASCDESSVEDCVDLSAGQSCDGMTFGGFSGVASCDAVVDLFVSGGQDCGGIYFELSGVGSIAQFNNRSVRWTGPGFNESGVCCYQEATITAYCCGIEIGAITIPIGAESEIEWFSGNATIMGRSTSQPVVVIGGVAPYFWNISGGKGFSLESDVTDDSANLVITDASACGTAHITVTDACGVVCTGYMKCTYGQWALKSESCGLSGSGYLTGGYASYGACNDAAGGGIEFYLERITGYQKQTITGQNCAFGFWAYECPGGDALCDNPDVAPSGECLTYSGAEYRGSNDCYPANIPNSVMECATFWKDPRYYEWECV